MWTASLFLLASTAATAGPTVPIGDLAGTWELVEAPPFDPAAAWPHGIENMRYVFDDKGNWWSLNSDERLSKTKPIGTVERLTETRVRFHTPEGKAPESPIRIRDGQLEIIHGDHGGWLYKRIDDPVRREGPIALKSLERLEVDAQSSAAGSFHEYLKLSTVQSRITDRRLDGVWELVRVRGVPLDKRPDQGYYNDVLVVAPGHFCFIQRGEQNGGLCADAEQDGARIKLKDDKGVEATALTVSFDAFGKLELAEGEFVQTFERIGTDPATAPAVALKIAVYREAQ